MVNMEQPAAFKRAVRNFITEAEADPALRRVQR
jgi:hypothetical protein